MFDRYENFKTIFLKEEKLLEEYRTRLISDVVTGKVDVRNIKVEDVGDEEVRNTLESFEEVEELEESIEAEQ